MEQEIRIGKRIKELRKLRGISQAALADAINSSQPVVHRWEAGERMPSFAAALRMARFFEVEISDFLADDLKAGSDPTWEKRDIAIKQLTEDLQKLNISGIKEADKHIQLLARIPEYQRHNETLEN